MTYWTAVLAGITAFATTGFVVVAFLWLRRLREEVARALAETANQQIRNAQQLAEALAQVQKQQRSYEQKIQTLAKAGIRLQQELTNVSARIENTGMTVLRGDQTLH